MPAVLEQLPHLFPRPRQARHDRANRHAQDFGDVAVAHLLETNQHDHLAMLGRETVQRLGYGSDGQAVLLLRRNCTLAVHQVVHGLHNGGSAIAAQATDMEVAQHGEEPGAQRPGGIVNVALEHRPLEAVLHQVIGQRRVARQRPGEAAEHGDFSGKLAAKVHECPFCRRLRRHEGRYSMHQTGVSPAEAGAQLRCRHARTTAIKRARRSPLARPLVPQCHQFLGGSGVNGHGGVKVGLLRPQPQ